MLLVETGFGVAGAESYASVADISAYWAGRPGPDATAWAAADLAHQEGAARVASEYLDANHLAPGRASVVGQVLSFPYADAEDTADAITRLRRATSMLAPLALSGPLVATAPADPQVLSSTDKLGDITESRTYAERQGVVMVNGRDLSFLDRLLSGLGGGGIVLGRRHLG